MSYTNNTGTSDTATYTANANVSGTDQFTYRVSDGKGGTDTATVTVTLETVQNAVGRALPIRKLNCWKHDYNIRNIL